MNRAIFIVEVSNAMLPRRIPFIALFLAIGLAFCLRASPVDADCAADTGVTVKMRAYLALCGYNMMPGAGSIPTPPPTPTVKPWHWLEYVNGYRAMGTLPPLAENTSWSYGEIMHARYMVKNDVAQHSENPGNPWYTPEGQAAAQNSNLVASASLSETSDIWAIDSWMMAPFHAVGILDPQLRQSGFGSYREPGPGLQFAAGIDVLRGLDAEEPEDVRFPIFWPGPGAVVPIRQHWSETPEPLTSCPGYTIPSGLPIIVQVGSGGLIPSVTAHAFMRGITPLEHCVFDESTYYNPDAGLQGLGRSILKLRDAVVLVPRAPLEPLTTYSVSLTVDGHTYAWSFSVGNIP